MTLPVLLLTRPQETDGRTAQAALNAGFSAISAPLLRIEPLEWNLPADMPEALLFTSAHAPGLVAARAPGLLRLPVYAVGPNTARAAEDAGFAVAMAGETDGSEIVRRAFEAGVRSLLHAGGETTAAYAVPDGLSVARVAVYAARPVSGLDAETAARLKRGEIFAVLLFSPRTAAIFTQALTGAGVPRGGLRIIALSPAVARMAGAGWKAVDIAGKPSLEEALAAARRLWHGMNDE